MKSDVKANKYQQEIKDLVTVYLTVFSKKYLQNLKPNVKHFGQYSIHFDIVRQEQGGCFFLPNGQNPLRVTSSLSAVP